MKNFKKLILEKKIMGSNYYIPLIMIIFIIIYSLILVKENALIENIIIGVYQMIIPLFATWWVIFYLFDILEEVGSEVFFTYKISNLKLGLMNVLKYIIFYMLLVLILLICLLNAFGISDNMYFIVIILLQSLFYGALAFFIMSLLKNSGWTIFIVLSVFSVIYLTGNRDFKEIDIYYRSRQVIPGISEMLAISYKIIPFVLIFFILGQIFFTKDFRIFKINKKN